MISIVIPALNEEKFLPGCLESLKSQDYEGEYEIIVADNGSTDLTAEIARKYGARVVPCFEKKSVFYARQVGANAASGDIIVQADADTIYPGDWLKRIAIRLNSKPKAVAVAGRFTYTDPPFWAKMEFYIRHLANIITIILIGRPLVISGATFAFRREAFLAVNGYKGITYAADQYGIASRLSLKGKVLYDRKLCVFTSSRRVNKPFLRIVRDFAANLGGWGKYLWASHISHPVASLVRIQPRQVFGFLLPIIIILLLLIAYGYFVPASPVFGQVYTKGKPTGAHVALTFDDSPNGIYTPQVLDILARYNVKATFFIIGKNVEAHPDVTRRIVREGHVVGNHSYSHNANHALTLSGIRDLKQAQATISEIVGVKPHLYRPPHGKKSPWELRSVKKEGLIEVTWSVATEEQDSKSSWYIARQIIRKTDPGEIILLHDGYGTSHDFGKFDEKVIIEALPIIIERLQAEGYTFVTVPELLKVPAYID